MRRAGGRVVGSVLAAVVLVAAGGLSAGSAAPVLDTCVDCHQAQSNRSLSRQVGAMAQDAHGRAGMSCDSCHGGDKTTGMEDPYESMDPKKGYIGIPKRSQVAAMCGKCHGDPLLMRNFAPMLPTDQVAKLATSRHGQAAARDQKGAASCSSCHRAHGVHAALDPRSSVHASNVPTMCGRCHADPRLMEPAQLPVDVVKTYTQSVHWRAVVERGDRSAPVCHDCHGNHAAGTPQPAAIARVCGRCHTAEHDTFGRGKHAPLAGFRGCVECHSNHGIRRATDELLAPGGVCHRCHDKPGKAQDEARELYGVYRGLVAEMADLEAGMAPVAAAGISTAGCDAELRYARDKLLEGKRLVHSDAVDDIKARAGMGRAAVFRGRVVLERLQDQLRWRRRGALAFGAFALLVAMTMLARARMARDELREDSRE